ncbi:MAG: glycosyltransferase [Planctomycetota bacterium]
MVSSMRGGGSERQVLLLAQHLDRSRFQPHLYLSERAGDFLREVPEDVPVHSYEDCDAARGIYFPGRELRRQSEYVRQIVRDHHIESIYDRTFHMTLVAAGAGPRRVSTIVSPPHLALPLVEKRFVALKRRRLATAYRTSDAVVAVSQQAADSAESYYGLPHGSVTVIRNPVDAKTLRERAVVSSKPENETRLICVGRMTSEKGHADLIDAVSQLSERWPSNRPPLALRLVGDGPLRRDLERRVSDSRLSDTIEFVGAMQNAAAEIAAADALVLPSRFEGMPNVVLEAMALGVPVIATRAGGTIELQGDKPTAFWAEPGQSRSLADAILAFAESPETAAQHIDAAKRLIATDHELQTTLRIIESLL